MRGLVFLLLLVIMCLTLLHDNRAVVYPHVTCYETWLREASKAVRHEKWCEQ